MADGALDINSSPAMGVGDKSFVTEEKRRGKRRKSQETSSDGNVSVKHTRSLVAA